MTKNKNVDASSPPGKQTKVVDVYKRRNADGMIGRRRMTSPVSAGRKKGIIGHLEKWATSDNSPTGTTDANTFATKPVEKSQLDGIKRRQSTVPEWLMLSPRGEGCKKKTLRKIKLGKKRDAKRSTSFDDKEGNDDSGKTKARLSQDVIARKSPKLKVTPSISKASKTPVNENGKSPKPKGGAIKTPRQSLLSATRNTGPSKVKKYLPEVPFADDAEESSTMKIAQVEASKRADSSDDDDDDDDVPLYAMKFLTAKVGNTAPRLMSPKALPKTAKPKPSPRKSKSVNASPKSSASPTKVSKIEVVKRKSKSMVPPPSPTTPPINENSNELNSSTMREAKVGNTSPRLMSPKALPKTAKPKPSPRKSKSVNASPTPSASPTKASKRKVVKRKSKAMVPPPSPTTPSINENSNELRCSTMWKAEVAAPLSDDNDDEDDDVPAYAMKFLSSKVDDASPGLLSSPKTVSKKVVANRILWKSESTISAAEVVSPKQAVVSPPPKASPRKWKQISSEKLSASVLATEKSLQKNQSSPVLKPPRPSIFSGADNIGESQPPQSPKQESDDSRRHITSKRAFRSVGTIEKGNAYPSLSPKNKIEISHTRNTVTMSSQQICKGGTYKGLQSPQKEIENSRRRRTNKHGSRTINVAGDDNCKAVQSLKTGVDISQRQNTSERSSCTISSMEESVTMSQLNETNSSHRRSISERISDLQESYSPGCLSARTTSKVMQSPKRPNSIDALSPPPLWASPKVRSTSADAHSVSQQIALLQENLKTPVAGSTKTPSVSKNEQQRKDQALQNLQNERAPNDSPSIPLSLKSEALGNASLSSTVKSPQSFMPSTEVRKTGILNQESNAVCVSFHQRDAPTIGRLSSRSILTSGEPSPPGIQMQLEKITPATLSTGSKADLAKQESLSRSGHSISMSHHSSKSHGSDGKGKFLAREVQTMSRFVAELIGRFSKNPEFKRGWEFDNEKAVESWNPVSRKKWSERQTMRLIPPKIEEAEFAGSDHIEEKSSSHSSRYTADSGTVTYEEASIDAVEKLSKAHVSGAAIANQPKNHNESTNGKKTDEEASITSFHSESFEAQSQTGEKGSSPEQYNANTDTLHDSLLLPTPREQNHTIVLDLEMMVEDPVHEVRLQHMQVVSDLQGLMEKAKEETNTSKNRKNKERMLRDLLDTLTKVSDDEGTARVPATANLTVDEVSDIVTHINLCEQTNTSIRWDLIGDIIFPNGIGEETEEHLMTTESFSISKGLESPSSRDHRVSFSTKPEYAPDTRSSIPEDKEWAALNELSQYEEDTAEMFRSQYNLSEEEMTDVIAHLNLCEETGTQIRWDLIHRIIYPDDDIGLLPMSMPHEIHGGADDCKSAMTEGLDDESRISWFSIYPEFDDCASSMTFLVEGDEITAGKRTRGGSKSIDVSMSSVRRDSLDEIDRSSPPGGFPERPHSQTSPNWNTSLLRKRVHALQASSHSFGGGGKIDSQKSEKGNRSISMKSDAVPSIINDDTIHTQEVIFSTASSDSGETFEA